MVATAEYVLLAKHSRTQALVMPALCKQPPTRPSDPHADLTDFFKQVETYEARCFRSEREHFEVVEVLFGPERERFSLDMPPKRASHHTTFNNHRIEKDYEGGRVDIQPTCGLYPDFRPGSVYLLIGPSPNYLAWELIEAPKEDGWLLRVREAIKRGTPHAAQQGAAADRATASSVRRFVVFGNVTRALRSTAGGRPGS
jgi:hypothetical protein